MGEELRGIYEFGPFRLDPVERLLLRDGKPLALTPKAFDTLLALVENSGHIVEKDALMEKLWPDAVVEESTLAQNISTLRRVLGEGPSEHQYIETIPKHGYRFVAAVKALLRDDAALIVERHTRSRIVTEEEEQMGAPLEAEQAKRQAGLPASIQEPEGRGLKMSPVLLIAFVLLLGIVGALLYFRPAKTKEPETPVRAVAVLPFKPIATEGRDEMLELGMADALITKLSNIGRIVVRPTSSVRKYAGLEQDPVVAGRELKVDSVLDGSVQRVGERIRVTARLVMVEDGQTLWADSFDAKSTDIFAMEDSISEQMTRVLALKLTGEEEKLLRKRYTGNVEAYQLYLKGRYFWNKRTEDGLKKGIEYFEQAIAKDPHYALAYAGLADSYLMLGAADYGVLAPREAMPRAKSAAVKALELDEALAEAHTSLAFLYYIFDWNWAGAEKQFRRAIELNRNYATAHHWYGLYLTVVGRSNEGIQEMQRAQQLDPLSLIINSDLGIVFFYNRQYERSIEQLKKTLEVEPNFVPAHWDLGRAYAQKGMYKESISELQRAAELTDHAQVYQATLARVYASSGRRDEAIRILNELKEQAQRRYIFPHLIATIYAGLGERDQAFKWLQKAYEDRANGLIALKVEPAFDSLRSDPRFQDLLLRVGFAPP